MSSMLISGIQGSLIPSSQFLDSAANSAASPMPTGGPSFGETLKNAFDSANTLQNNAEQAATSFATGKASDIHDVMIAAQKASIALNLTAEVRNKVVDAYNTIMQMQM